MCHDKTETRVGELFRKLGRLSFWRITYSFSYASLSFINVPAVSCFCSFNYFFLKCVKCKIHICHKFIALNFRLYQKYQKFSAFSAFWETILYTLTSSILPQINQHQSEIVFHLKSINWGLKWGWAEKKCYWNGKILFFFTKQRVLSVFCCCIISSL